MVNSIPHGWRPVADESPLQTTHYPEVTLGFELQDQGRDKGNKALPGCIPPKVTLSITGTPRPIGIRLVPVREAIPTLGIGHSARDTALAPAQCFKAASTPATEREMTPEPA